MLNADFEVDCCVVLGSVGETEACLIGVVTLSSLVSPVSLLKNLKHANIVILHDIIHTDQSLTLVFEYLVSHHIAPGYFTSVAVCSIALRLTCRLVTCDPSPTQDSDLKQYLDNCGSLMSMHNVKVSSREYGLQSECVPQPMHEAPSAVRCGLLPGCPTLFLEIYYPVGFSLQF